MRPVNDIHIQSDGGLFFWLPATTATTYTPSNWTGYSNIFNSLDLLRWRLDRVSEHKNLPCSGSLGATASRQVGYSCQIKFDCCWVPDHSPDFLLKPMNGFFCVFYMGDIRGYNQYVITPRYYWCPVVNLDLGSPIVDPNNKKMIKMSCAAHCRTHCFLCPDEGTIDDASTDAGAYYKAYLGGYINV